MPRNLLLLVWRDPTSSRDAFAAQLHESLPDRLRSGGIELAQINVADAAVDAAAPLRQVALDPQPEALLRVELDQRNETAPGTNGTENAASTCTRVIDMLAGFTFVARSVGYLVSSREPLAAPNTRHSPGLRSPGFSQVALLRRHPDLSTGAFRTRWLDHHTTVAIETQSTFRYVQHVVQDVLTPGAPKLDGIVEECFPPEAMTDPHVFFDTGGEHQELTDRINTMVASVSAFLDLGTLDVIPTSEYRLDVA